jgi:tRNA (guanine10-N2)-dimethyltransferase
MASEFFIRTSGENEELANAEVKAVLESEEVQYNIQKKLPQVTLLSSVPRSLKVVSQKCSLVKEGGPLLFVCEAKPKEISKKVMGIHRSCLGSTQDTFSVRVRRIQGSSKEIQTEVLEEQIGRLILQKRPDMRVEFEKPTHPFVGLLTGEQMVFGLKRIEVRIRDFMSRRPRSKPFFHPASMSPVLARTMVNLSRCREGKLLLDPFCGTGGILVEAGLTGRRVLGSDVKMEMVSGTLQNLSHCGVSPDGLTVSEISHLPFVEVDSIATDAPYGKLSTTLGVHPESVIKRFLNSAAKIIPKGRYVCLGSRIKIDYKDMVREAGFKIIEDLQVREHRSLTRVISVLRRE